MKKFVLWFICSLFLCLSVAGCGNTLKNVPVIAATGTTVYVGHSAVVNVIKENLDLFSPREMVQLERANDRLVIVKAKVDAINNEKNGNVAELVMELPKLVPLYTEAKEAYLVAHGIILGRIDEFQREDQLVLYNYEATCERLDTAIHDALMSADGTDNAQLVSDIVSFILLVGKIVLPLLIL